jgi:EpsI family protein
MKPEKKRLLLLWTAVICLGITSFLIHEGKDVKAQHLMAPLQDLDLRLGLWRGVGPDINLDERTLDLFKPSDFLLRDYVNPSGENIAVFLAYFGLQEEGRIIHSPRHCLPGSGWQITSRKQIDINGKKDTYKVNHLIITNELEKLSVLYWYQGRGDIEANEYRERINLLLDGLTLKRSDGALVRLTMVVGPTNSDHLEDLISLAKPLIPALNKLMPPPGRAESS